MEFNSFSTLIIWTWMPLGPASGASLPVPEFVLDLLSAFSLALPEDHLDNRKRSQKTSQIHDFSTQVLSWELGLHPTST